MSTNRSRNDANLLLATTSKDAIKKVMEIDQELQTVKNAIYPCVKGNIVDSSLDDATLTRLLDLKMQLCADRKAAARLVHMLCELERMHPSRVESIECRRKRDVHAALSILDKVEGLRC